MITSSPTVVAIRVDASTRMGTGHVYRCLTLAAALARRGAEVHVIHRLHDGHMADVIRRAGHVVHTLPAPPHHTTLAIADGNYRAWAGVSEIEDADATRAVLCTIGAAWLIVDHYGFGQTWQQRLRTTVPHIMVIDDLADRTHDCDILLDQNWYARAESRYDDRVPPQCLRLCGPRFALIAPEYAAARPSTAPREGPVSRVLVFYGGSDEAGLTAQALRVLSQPAFLHLSVDVVVGRNAADGHVVRQLAAARGRTSVHDTLPSLLPLMLHADLAIGAGGITSWERCCVGLPALVTVVAQNQAAPSTALAVAGACLLVGALPGAGGNSADLSTALSTALQSLLDHPAQYAQIAQAAWDVGEGRGADIVAEVLLPSPHETLRLRDARMDDCRQYWHWVNDPAVRDASIQDGVIDWPTHFAWFSRRLGVTDGALCVLETAQGVPLGQFRVDVTNGRGIIDYSIDRMFRGRGLGNALIRRGVQAWIHRSPHMPLDARVKRDNTASAKAFLASGLFELVVDISHDPRDVIDFTMCPQEVSACSP